MAGVIRTPEKALTYEKSKMMTTFINYHDLTWPDIKELPRDTPLIIPVGERQMQPHLATKLNNPNLIGLLPYIPFGWVGSGLAVPKNILAAYIKNLIDGLSDDGFKNVYVSKPVGVDLGLEDNEIIISLSSSDSEYIKTTPIPPPGDIDKVVIIPIGHTEQHGFHLPMSTDTTIINAIAQGIVRDIPNLAASLPAFPYGISTHRPSFAGTLNAGGRAFEDFWLEIIAALVKRGFSKFYLISGHGGNCSFLVNVVKYAGELFRRIFCATSWLYLSGPTGIKQLNELRDSGIGGMGHAGELETSLILHLTSDLVRMQLVVDETEFISTPSYSMDWVEGGPLIANPPWDDDTITGSYGAGSLATAEKGRLWLQAAIQEKIGHVVEINEQHARREMRRNSGYGMWGNSN